MRILKINTIKSDEVLKQLAIHLKGVIKKSWGESVLEFNNEFGKGQIRCIEFDWGVSLIDYNVYFNEELKIIFQTTDIRPIKFVFVSEGNLKFYSECEKKELSFKQFQNIIISNKKNTKSIYLYPAKVTVKVNFIHVLRHEYAKKKNNNLNYLNNKLSSVFQDNKSNVMYNHFGNFNLKIANQVKQLQDAFDSGIVRTLTVEGQLNLIMAMQMLEHSNFENGTGIPETMSKLEIKKIHELSGYIIDNISENLTVKSLARHSGLSPKKLQLGFKLLHSKTVNEHVRQIKLEISRGYIDNSKDSISEIVYKVGFKSRSYFSKIFFEHYGILPNEYRKLTLQKNK